MRPLPSGFGAVRIVPVSTSAKVQNYISRTKSGLTRERVGGQSPPILMKKADTPTPNPPPPDPWGANPRQPFGRGGFGGVGECGAPARPCRTALTHFNLFNYDRPQKHAKIALFRHILNSPNGAKKTPKNLHMSQKFSTFVSTIRTNNPLRPATPAHNLGEHYDTNKSKCSKNLHHGSGHQQPHLGNHTGGKA